MSLVEFDPYSMREIQHSIMLGRAISDVAYIDPATHQEKVDLKLRALVEMAATVQGELTFDEDEVADTPVDVAILYMHAVRDYRVKQDAYTRFGLLPQARQRISYAIHRLRSDPQFICPPDIDNVA